MRPRIRISSGKPRLKPGAWWNEAHLRISARRRFEIVRSMPLHAQIEVATRCNLSCVMCPRTVALANPVNDHERSAWHRVLSLGRFRSIVEQLPHLSTITLHGIGEPLLNRDLPEMIAFASNRGIKVRFTTNGTLLDADMRKRLLDGRLARLTVSIDGATTETYERIRIGASFASVIEQVRAFKEERDARGMTQPDIWIAMVVSRENATETSQMIELAHALGADKVTLSPVEPSAKSVEPLVCAPDEWRRAISAARTRAKTLGMALWVRGGTGLFHGPTVALANPQAHRPIVRAPAEIKATHRCTMPWKTAFFSLNGDVMPCCNIHDTRDRMGSLNDDDFSAIWNGQHYRTLRKILPIKGQVPTCCRWCPDF